MHHQINNIDKLRLAIALVALKYKPAHQSYYSYALDLRAAFGKKEPQIDQSLSDTWRKRALSLEKDLETLREKQDRDHAELLALRAIVPTTTEAPTLTTDKKKQKRVRQQQQRPTKQMTPIPRLVGILGCVSGTPATGGETSLQFSSTDGSLVSALQTLESLAECVNAQSSSAEMTEILLATTDRCITQLASTISSIISTSTDQEANKKEKIAPDVLLTVSSLLTYFLTTALPLLLSPACKPPRAKPADGKPKRSLQAERARLLEFFAGRLTSLILVPLVCSFAKLSERHLSRLFDSKSSSSSSKSRSPIFSKEITSSADIRPTVLQVLSQALAAIYSCLDSVSSSAQSALSSAIASIKEILALQVVRQLEQLYSTPSRDTQPVSRLGRLVRKDTTWYLCATLHLTLENPSGSCTTTIPELTQAVLHENICRALASVLESMRPRVNGYSSGRLEEMRTADLGTSTRGVVGPSEVERGMVLCIVERLWLVQG